MGGGNMNGVLSKYVKDNYKNGKADLATVFVEMMGQRTSANGSYAFIIPPSWMFLSTFEGLRKNIIEYQSIESLLHLSRGVFGADFGASSAVIKNTSNANACGTYFRLVERTFQEFEQSHLRMLFEQTLANHDFKYNFKEYTKDVTELPYSEDGNRIYYPNVEQKNFEKIPGCPIGYWATEKIISLFDKPRIDSLCFPLQGLSTTDNGKYIKIWSEVDFRQIKLATKTPEESVLSSKKWYPINKGGGTKKWYGNQIEVINWRHNGEDVKSNPKADVRGEEGYFKPSVTWNKICSSYVTFRYYPEGFIVDSASNVIPCDDTKSMMGYLCSKITNLIGAIINPTLNLSNGVLGRFPYLGVDNHQIHDIVDNCITISRQDWDSHETSWDFQCNELLSVDEQTYMDNINNFVESHYKETGEHLCIDPATPQLDSLAWRIEQYKQKWKHKFKQLHENEEELNRQFIDIYGLQNELTPDVPLDEITILQQGEIAIKDNKIEWHDDVLIKQLISYAVGCMMGRYSIDKPGFILANQGDGLEEYEALVPNSRFEIDDDGIIPLMASNSDFADNATVRFKKWLAVVLGEDRLVENLNTVEAALGKTIDDFFVKDFWKYHKKMYQNRPIYWLFSSKKGAFQCIAYMHRMTPYTAEQIRTKYLLPHIEWLVQKQSEMEENSVNLSTAERRELDRLTTQITECREYHDRLHEVADKQIAFDLDDGVVVNYAKFGDVLQKLK